MNQSIEEIVALYNAQAEAYFARTAHLDMSASLKEFADRLPAGAFVVDAGCGSGRDTAWFIANGFRCYSYDASEELCHQAQGLLGTALQVQCHRHDQLALPEPVDGIWASASLLFLSDADLQASLTALAANLKPGGLLVTSFKQGSGWRQDTDRKFRDLQPDDIDLLATWSGLQPAGTSLQLDSMGRGNNWVSFSLQKAA